MLSSGMFEDFRILFGNQIAVTLLADGWFKVVDVEQPSPMRHFEPSGGENCSLGRGSFLPNYRVHKIVTRSSLRPAFNRSKQKCLGQISA